MTLSPAYIVAIVVGSGLYLVILYMVHQALAGTTQVAFRYAAIAATLAAFFFGMGRLVDQHDRIVDITKALLAISAAGCVFYEQYRAGQKRPVAERWKRFVGVALGVAAIIAYFNGFKFGYARYYHRWDQYHYYMGAKYFRELGYDGLYKCSAIAQDELGVVPYKNEDQIGTGPVKLDMSKEVRHPDKKIRNLGGDNLLIPVTDILAHPEICKDHFSPERWDLYKADVRFFRIASDKQYWEDMQKDHGYNPPPVWTVLGYYFSNAHAATTNYLQFLASLDILYLLGTFAILWWAFGWRVFAVSAIFWGCQHSAPFYWTGGAFLRQDWLFFLVLAACAVRKKWFVVAGAAMVYAGLLRVFPGLPVIGWLVVAAAYLIKHKRMAKSHVRVLAGGVLAAALLIPLSIHVSGKDSYQQFFKHTLEVHDQTPLTNHMGLRVLISHNLGGTAASGRMKYTKDTKLADPFEVWKRMRNERYAKLKPVAYAIIGLSLLFFVYVCRRIKSLWIAQCLAQIFIILMSQLTCYYYSFMILMGPLSKVKRNIEAPLFGLAALTQFVGILMFWNDDKYAGLTLISLMFCYWVLAVFMTQAQRDKVSRLFGRGKEEPAVAPAAGPSGGDE